MITAGAYLTVNSNSPSDLEIVKVDTGLTDHIRYDQLTTLTTNEDGIKPVAGRDFFITSGTSINLLYLYHYDGRETPLPNNTASGNVVSIAVSGDGSVAAFCTVSNNQIVLYNLDTKTVIGVVTAGFTINAAYAFMALNANGSKLCVHPYGKALEIYNTADQTLDATGDITTQCRGLAANGNDWVFIDADQDVFSLTSAGVTTEEITNALNGTFNLGKNFNISPNGKYLVIGGHDVNGSVVVINLADFTTIPLPPLPSYGVVYRWKDDNTLYAFVTYASGSYGYGYFESKFNGTVFTPFKRKGYLSVNAYAVGEFVYDVMAEVSGTITDNAEETQFKVSATLMDGVTHVGTTTLPAGETNFTLQVPTQAPVIVTISGVVDTMHQIDRDYLVGDMIFVGDTIYTYECTTAGHTALTKPAYPTTGTITDGSAVFTVRGKLARPVVNSPVYPVLNIM